VLVTFHLVLLAWVFFRAASLPDALLVLSRIGTGLFSPLYLGFSSVATLLGLALVALLLVVQLLQYRGRLPLYFSHVPIPIAARWSGYLAMLLGIAFFGRGGSDFIYFQF